ncbi:MAG: sulfotransferase [Methylomicrobium sp.]|nr:sulfotransferase [Methylomicrobium sp.]
MSTYLLQGQNAINSGNMDNAVSWFKKAVLEKPKDAQALACLGQALCWTRQNREGLVYLRKSGSLLAHASRKTGNTQQLLLLAEQLQFWNDYPSSLELIKQAVQINKDVRGFQLLAHTYSRLNINDLALTASLQALRKAPENAVLNLQHAMLEARNKQYHAAIERLIRVLQMAASNESSFRAHKELARIYDKLGIYEQVFEHLHAAAEHARHIPEVQKQDNAFVFDLLAAYSSGFETPLMNRWATSEWLSEHRAPVFLVGFFRSGTTLTQEILDTHPDVFVSDETDLVVAMKDELNRISSIKDKPIEQLRAASADNIRHLRGFYWQLAEQRYGKEINQKLFLDKTTMNTFDLGLLNVIFPDAKVIFMMRDPRDVCLSCFMQVMTPSAATVHLLDWQSTARFYARTMNWWLHISPLLTMDTMTLRYEDGITDFSASFSHIFDFLGLSWNEQAVEFHKLAAKKFIASPSFDQVTQPLYTTSIGRWKHYAHEFDAISEVLEPYIDAFGYSKDTKNETEKFINETPR